jgi:uncharacterized membrane protein
MSLTISSVISRSWKAFTQNIGTWLLVDLILILTQIPGNIGRSSTSSQLTNFSDPDFLSKVAETNSETSSPINFFVQIIMGLIAIYVSMATIRFASAHLKDKKISFSEAFEFKQYWSVLGASILVGLIVVPISLLIGGTLIGFLASTFAFSNGNPQFNTGSSIFLLAFIASMILLIWVAIRLSFVQQFVQLSDKGVVDSIIASWKATKGKVLFLVGFGLVMGALMIAAFAPLFLGLLLWFPLAIISSVDVYNQISKASSEESPKIMV